MAPVIPCSFGNVTLSTKTPCYLGKEVSLVKCNVHRKFSRSPNSYGRYLWFQPVSLRLLQQYNSYYSSKHALRLQQSAAVGTDVAMEEKNSTLSTELVEESTEITQGDAVIDDASTSSSAATPARSKRSRPSRKSEMPPVNDEDLVPGATFMGKVRSIQPFGAFIDFGAFTDGLVHVSKLSDGFVKDVATVVTVGQEVKVRIVEVNKETGRISLSMRENDDVSKSPPRKETYGNTENEKPRNTRKNAPRSNQRRDDEQKSTKFVKGQVLEGTVKNLGRSGAFISLPDGEEGFLPMSEESEGFGNILGSSSLQAGQEVSVRVLRISRGQLTLTMKKEEDVEAINKQLNQGVVHTATNPFVLAFRQNKEIAAFLDKQEKVEESIEASVSENVVEEIVEVTKDEAEAPETPPAEPVAEAAAIVEPITVEELTSEATLMESDSVPAEASVENGLIEADSSAEAVEDGSDSSSSPSLSSETPVPEPVIATETVEHVSIVESASEDGNAKGSVVADAGTEDVSETDDKKEDDPVLESKTDSEVGVVVNAAAGSEVVGETETETSPSEQTDESSLPPEVVVAEETVANQPNGALTEEEKPESADDVTSSDEPSVVTLETDAVVSAEQNNSSSEGDSTKVVITPALVKKLREETGAGMMDCKNALAATGGDITKAQEFLRKKGLASADKRAGKATAEGRIGTYIHDNRIGILVEVNCETDFVSRGNIFKELVEDLAMQVAACPQVQYLVPEDVPEEIVNKEREIEMQKEDLQSKPDQFRSRIVEGRISKRLQELALLEQPYIKNDKVVVKDWVKQAIAAVGENIRVKRFVRYNLGEGLEKRSQNFAAEVAAQTVAKAPPPSAPEEKPAEDGQPKAMTPAVVVSAALVKQLREETGAGMMDCKKALAETGGDLEKAQEYLRKKGISSAAKKSSRITADGRIASYVHDSRIGALIEVNSETDFVARNEKFKELVNDLAMQVVACPQVQFVSVEDVPESVIAKEKEIEMQREDLQSKPEQIREKIVDGRISKRLAELALLEQPFIKDDKLLVKDLVSQTVAALGENIKVRRFARFTLGE